ncbi:uncharacterized protein N7518_000511 [Penicillium psychrosexuale]|uniref:uncharacterized protein n=1 Tax=Penicillium psychrosexuale TaxID=1002107 RepID=UPI002544EEAA|nr:uncharacterized protein N7518_000511 [Penicillium psychrosexuale]KAJ5804208.1 hypothetical protein N7518_000511 [Penicillium psychrosexuale]
MAMELDRDMDRLVSESNTFLFPIRVKSKLRAYSVRFITVVFSRPAPPPIANTSENFHSYNSLPRDFSETLDSFKPSNLNVLYDLKPGIELCCRLVAR